MKKAVKFGALLFMAFAACTPQTPDPEPEPGETSVGQSVIIPQEAGTEVTVEIEAAENWQIVNNTDWLSISPLSGFAGEATLKMYSRESNMDVSERQGTFTLVVGEIERVTFHVFQDGAEGLRLKSSTANATGDAGQVQVYVDANTEFTAESDQNWASVENIEYGVETTLLDDGVTVSKLQTACITVNVDENKDNGFRNAVLSLACGGNEYEVILVQSPKSDAAVSDWSASFFRRTLGRRFTATTCGYCPGMDTVFKEALEDNPDRFVPVSFYGVYGGMSSDIHSDYYEEFGDIYNIMGVPTAIVNDIADVPNYTNPQITLNAVNGLIEEAVTALPSKTGIATVCALNGNNFSLLCSVATKEARPYRLHVFLLEDGVVGYQSSYYSDIPGGSNYVHDAVQRCALTGAEGVELEGADNGIVTYLTNYDIPDGTFDDINNAYAVIVVTYESDGLFNGTAPYAEYTDFGMVVDNVVKIPLNGQTDFEYED